MRFSFAELDRLIKGENLSYEQIGRMYAVSGTYVKKAYIKLGGTVTKRKKGNLFPAMREKKIKEKCKNCGKDIYIYRHPFCSKECAYEYRNKQKIEKWNAHLLKYRKKGYKIPVAILRAQYMEQDQKCIKCKEHKKENQLIPYFKDGNSLHIEKGVMVLLCSDCYKTSLFQKPNIILPR